MPADARPHVLQEGLPVLDGHVIQQRIAGQGLPVDVQQAGPREVDFLDVAVFVQRDVAQRGEVVKVRVAVAVGLQMPLRRAQLAVLLLQRVQPGSKFGDQAFHFGELARLRTVRVRVPEFIDERRQLLRFFPRVVVHGWLSSVGFHVGHVVNLSRQTGNLSYEHLSGCAGRTIPVACLGPPLRPLNSSHKARESTDLIIITNINATNSPMLRHGSERLPLLRFARQMAGGMPIVNYAGGEYLTTAIFA